MNDNEQINQNFLRSLLLMTELEKGESVSQREIAGRLGNSNASCINILSSLNRS